MTENPTPEPPLTAQLPELVRENEAKAFRLLNVKRKHDERRKGKSDLPVFPVGPEAA